MDKLDFDTVYRVISQTELSLSPQEAQEKAVKHLDELYGEGKWEGAPEPEEDLTEYANEVANFEDDDEALEYLTDEQNLSDTEAARVVQQAKNSNDRFYKKLDDVDKRALAKLQATHPERKYTAEKYFKLMNR